VAEIQNVTDARSVESETNNYPLFLDEPTDVDLLSFDAVASTLVDAVLDPRLDPTAWNQGIEMGSRL